MNKTASAAVFAACAFALCAAPINVLAQGRAPTLPHARIVKKLVCVLNVSGGENAAASQQASKTTTLNSKGLTGIKLQLTRLSDGVVFTGVAVADNIGVRDVSITRNGNLSAESTARDHAPGLEASLGRGNRYSSSFNCDIKRVVSP